MSLKLEVGKYYRTRDGHKAGPLRAGGQPGEVSAYCFNCPTLKLSFLDTGRYHEMFPTHDNDLVAEWTVDHWAALDAKSCSHSPHRDELTGDAAIVNAFNHLVKAGRIEAVRGQDGYPTPYPVRTNAEYSLKPTTPTTTLPDSGWVAVIDPVDEVKVGCRNKHSIAPLRCALAALVRKNAPKIYVEGMTLIATRSGIVEGTDTMTWADADALLAFLEEK